MIQNIKVSVTVPVFNTSKYLKKCLDSLNQQTLNEIEIILVDDGSTDYSGAICEEYSKKNPKFITIHQKNGGLASARQTGLKTAKGEYVIVCDSDDWVEADMYKRLYEEAIKYNADIVICGYFLEYTDGRTVPSNIKFKADNGIINDNLEVLKKSTASSWVKLIKRSFFEKHNISYTKGINLGEDVLLTYKLLKYNPRIVAIDNRLYHYRRLFGGQSYTNSLSMKSILELNYTYQWLKKNYTQKRHTKFVTQKAVDLAFAMLRVDDLDLDFFNEFLRGEITIKRFIRLFPNPKILMVLGSKFLPYGLMRFILDKLYRYVYK